MAVMAMMGIYWRNAVKAFTLFITLYIYIIHFKAYAGAYFLLYKIN